MISTGVVTGLPLVWFGHAARHLRMTTVGFLQYLAPSCSFFLGVFLYHEPFTRAHLITFSFIWVALAHFYRRSHLALAQRSDGRDCRAAGRTATSRSAAIPNPMPKVQSSLKTRLHCEGLGSELPSELDFGRVSPYQVAFERLLYRSGADD